MHAYIIRKSGDKWQVLPEDGSKVLGTHDTEEQAKKQLRAIEISKAKAAGKFELDGVEIDFESNLQTIRNVDVFAVGTWRGTNSPDSGDEYTETDLQDMVAAYKSGAMSPLIKITHGADGEQVDVGKVDNLRVKNGKLFCDFIDVPHGLYELMKRGLFRTRSAEVLWNMKDYAGRMWRRVLKAVALLAPGQKPAVSAISEGYQFEAQYCYELPDSFAAKRRGNIESIVKAWPQWAGKEPGTFTQCVEILKGKEGIDNPEALCAWLHKKAEGVTPNEKKHEGYEPTDDELSVASVAVGAVLSYLAYQNKLTEEGGQMKLQELLLKYGCSTEDELTDKLNSNDEKIKAYEAEKKSLRAEAKKLYLDEEGNAGRLLPKLRPMVEKLFEALDGNEDATKELKAFLNGLPNIVKFEEQSKEDTKDTHAAYDGKSPASVEVDRMAKEFCKTDKNLTYMTALRKVKVAHPDLWEAYVRKGV